jgi:hypothetical protein
MIPYMKLLISYLFLGGTLQLQAQKTIHPLRVYITAAVTHDTLTDARVFLEALNKKPVKLAYSTKEHCYFGKETPIGYNTVMVYHDAYNEKGYQAEKLPDVLSFELYTPYRIPVKRDGYTDYYAEEKDKLLLFFAQDTDPDYLMNMEAKMYEFEDYKSYINSHYPELKVIQSCQNGYAGPTSILVVKKNGDDFKRFNDPLIARINADDNIATTLGAMYITKNTRAQKEYFGPHGKPSFIPEYAKYIGIDEILGWAAAYKKGEGYQFKYGEGFGYATRTPLTAADMKTNQKAFLRRLKKMKKAQNKILLARYTFITDNNLSSTNDILPRDVKEVAKLYKVCKADRDAHLLYYFDTAIDYTATVPVKFDFYYPRYYYSGYSKPMYYPYITISGSIKSILGVCFNFEVLPYSADGIQDGALLEQATKAKGKVILYRFTGSTASPFGTMDMTEHYNKAHDKPIQQCQGHIQGDDNQRQF